MLDTIARELQSLYSLDVLDSVAPYLIDSDTYAAWCDTQTFSDRDAPEALLIAPDADGVAIGLYLHPEIFTQLARESPATRLTAQNFSASCVAIEGVSHLLYALTKWTREEPVSLLELELQAEVDRYLVLATWLRRQGASGRALHAQLFDTCELRGAIGEESAQDRYQRAHALAKRLCAKLAYDDLRHAHHHMRRTARQFFESTHWQKIRLA